MSTEASSELRTPARREIPGLLKELEASGESLAAFARTRGVRSWKLYKARRKLRPSKPEVELVPVRVVDEPRAEAIGLVLAFGHRLEIPRNFDETLLRRLLEVLASC